MNNISAIYQTKLNKRFIILIVAVSVSGFSQGLLLPLLSVLLEKQGVSSVYNGLNSSALYLGMLFASIFIEKYVRKMGFKKVIVYGISLTTVSIFLFPIWVNLFFWIVLRLLVGIGDTAIHFATQTWITSTVEAEKRGRSISLYGLSYGIGFGIGPFGLMLLQFGSFVPFVIATLLFSMILIFVMGLEDEKTEFSDSKDGDSRYFKVMKYAGIALMPIFIFGILEATLNNTFPIYGLREGLEEKQVSLLLSSFIIGSLIFQLPLGILSDLIGRKKVLIFTTLLGGILFLLFPYTQSFIQMFIIFVLAGGLLGSLFSLGLAYVADLVSKDLLPTANIMAGILFGLGSIVGPYIGGTTISLFTSSSLFIFLGSIFLFFSILSIITNMTNNRKSY